MKNSFKVLALLICTQIGASSHLVKIDKSARFASHKLGDVDLYHHNGQFMVKHENELHHVKTENIVTPELRNVNLKALSAMLEHGKIHINQNDEKDFIIRAQIHGLGGGKVLGKIFKGVIFGSGCVVIATAVYLKVCPPESVAQAKSGLEAACLIAEVAGEAIPGPL